MSDPLLSCQNRLDLYQLMSRAGDVGPAVEVGVAEGLNAFSMLEIWPQLAQLYLVDLWCSQPMEVYTDGCNTDSYNLEQMMTDCEQRLEPYAGRFKLCRGESTAIAKQLAALPQPPSFSLGYIDANHSYDGVRQDCEVWYPLIRSGGIFAGHDHDHDHPGVVRAVRELSERYKCPVHLLTGNGDCSWAVRKP